jgi:radical SAM protein with 4Fe4S-binding SPASM domain
MKDFIGKKVDLSVRQPYRRYSCGLGKLGYGIGVEGDLYPCFRAYFIKNAHELKLGDIYNGENITNKAFLDLRYSKENSCTNCDISDFCEQCPVLTYETTGSFIKHNNEHCMPARAYVLGIQRAMLDAVIEKGVKRC